jgi:pimeloyl-ACP methyl ester carboxylesterase
VEYDPEWGRAFYAGTATANCDHAHMLARARAPVLFTHHYRAIDPSTGTVMGAVSDQQIDRARELVTHAGQPFEIMSFPGMAHSMHGQDPQLFTRTVADWSQTIPQDR